MLSHRISERFDLRTAVLLKYIYNFVETPEEIRPGPPPRQRPMMATPVVGRHMSLHSGFSAVWGDHPADPLCPLSSQGPEYLWAGTPATPAVDTRPPAAITQAGQAPALTEHLLCAGALLHTDRIAPPRKH